MITTNPDEKQVKYWQNRAETNYLAGEKEGLQLAKSLQQNYRDCVQQINKEISSFYRKICKRQ